ncbi:hypothetical protein YC2023_023637 [Brassica napus]
MKSIQHKQITPKHGYIKNIRITTKYNRPARRAGMPLARQSHKRIGVTRIETTTDNQRIVGLSIPNAAVKTVLQGIITKTFLM